MVSTRSGRIAELRSPAPLPRQPRRARRALRLASCTVAVALSLLLPAEARAEVTFTVAYKAFEACPDRGAFIHGVQLRSRIAKPVGAAEQPDIVFAVTIERSGPNGSRVSGRMVITQGVQASDRSVTGVQSAEVATALALIAAISIDPDAASAPDPEPLPLPPEPYGPTTLGSQPRLVTGPAPVIIPAWSPPAFWPAALIPETSDSDLIARPLPADPFFVPPRSPDAPEIGFGARLVLDVGPAPTPMFGGAGQLELRQLGDLPWSLRAELSYTVTAEASPEDTVDSSYRMLRGRFVGCIPAWIPASWFRLWPCASVGGGGHWAELRRLSDSVATESAGPWFEIGASAKADFAPLRWLTVELQAGPALALVRGTFVAAGEIVYEPPPATFGAGVGVSASF